MSIWIVIGNEYKRHQANKKKWLITLLLPIITVIAAIGIQAVMKPTITLGWMQNGDSTLGNRFVQQAAEIDGIRLREADPSTMRTDMMLSKYEAVIIFEQEHSAVVHSLDTHLGSTVQEILAVYEETGHLIGLGAMIVNLEQGRLSVTERSIGLILMTLIITSAMTASSFIRDHQEGLLRRYKMTPASVNAYMSAVFGFNFMLTVVQVMLAGAVIGLLHLDTATELLAFLASGISCAFVASALSAFIVSVMRSELHVSLAASLTALMMSLLGGAFLPVSKMPDVLQWLSQLSVTRWLMEMAATMEDGYMGVSDWVPLAVIAVMGTTLLLSAIFISQRTFIN